MMVEEVVWRLEEEIEVWAYLGNSRILDTYAYIKGIQIFVLTGISRIMMIEKEWNGSQIGRHHGNEVVV